MSSKEIIKKLAEAGFIQISQNGSHQKWQHPDGRMTVVPHPKKDLPRGTIANIARQAKIHF